jgi:hypothetical protein
MFPGNNAQASSQSALPTKPNVRGHLSGRKAVRARGIDFPQACSGLERQKRVTRFALEAADAAGWPAQSRHRHLQKAPSLWAESPRERIR